MSVFLLKHLMFIHRVLVSSWFVLFCAVELLRAIAMCRREKETEKNFEDV